MTLGLWFSAASAPGGAYWLIGDWLPSQEAAHISLLLSITLAAGIPMVAELSEADWRKGSAAALQPVPLTSGQGASVGPVSSHDGSPRSGRRPQADV